MLYMPAELVGELGMPAQTLYSWYKASAPHIRDDESNLWIVGRDFAGRVAAHRKPNAGTRKAG